MNHCVYNRASDDEGDEFEHEENHSNSEAHHAQEEKSE
jgi:hypothetical protein